MSRMELWVGLLAVGLSVPLGFIVGYVTREHIVGVAFGVVVFALIVFVGSRSPKKAYREPSGKEKRGEQIPERQSDLGGHATRTIGPQTARTVRARKEPEKPEEASVGRETTTELQPDKSEACYAKGEALCDLRRYGEALHYFDEAIRLKPDHSRAWYDKGLCLLELDRSDEAEVALKEAMRLRSRT